MISLRGQDVHLLALRGRFAVDGRTMSGVVLRDGMVVSLAHGLDLEVVSARVPDAVLALEADGMARQVLSGVTSVYGGRRPRMGSGWQADASDHVWPTGNTWMRSGEGPIPLEAGDEWSVDGTKFRAVQQRVQGANATVGELDYARPLTLTARYDTVHIARRGQAVVVITGRMARVISELVEARAPLSWGDLAHQLWDESDPSILRRRWDMQLLRLRQKLRDHDIRPDLLRPDGTGLIELVLGPDDILVDEL